ncbi:MAG: type II toxin-antitoxin system RelE/ParE family toxin [Verrucomicrobiota bacterium]|jgi:plasmid stabilization system protein ParE
MKREIIFASAAGLEFNEAILWYDDQQPGLGDEFEGEVTRVLEEIQEDPERFRLVGPTIRKARLLRRFRRYSIFFNIQPDHIGVVSVFDVSRNPDELRQRLK